MTEKTILVNGPYCWAQGLTLEEACKEAVRFGPDSVRDLRLRGYLVKRDDWTINEFGQVESPICEPLGLIDPDTYR